MFQVKNGRVQFKVDKQLSKKQLQRMKYVPSRSVQAYLQACLGMSKAKVAFVPPQDDGPDDTLRSKQGGATLKELKNILRNGHSMNHKPIANGGAWVGVELEFFVPRMQNDDGEDYDTDTMHDEIRHAFEQAGIKRASVRGDGSIDGDNDDDVDVEVTLLFNTKNGYEQLQKVCKILKRDFNASVNQSCGMHVHFDFSGQEKPHVKQMGKKLLRFLPIMSMLVPKSRRQNNYCELDMSNFSGSRYYAINLTSFEKHGTIEVRLHSGTLDAKKTQCWIELIQLIFKSEYASGSITTLQGMFDALNMPDRLVEYCERRYTSLNPEGAGIVVAPEVHEEQTADMELAADSRVEIDTQLLGRTFREALTRTAETSDEGVA